MRYRVMTAAVRLPGAGWAYRGDVVEVREVEGAALVRSGDLEAIDAEPHGPGDQLDGVGHVGIAAAAGRLGLSAGRADTMTTIELLDYVEAGGWPEDSAPWSAWAKHARAHGLDAGTIAGLSRAELIDATRGAR